MLSPESRDVLQRGKALYTERLKERLEQSHMNYFVVIEPDSGDYFLGRTAGEAGAAARRAHPNRLTYIMRVGHSAAFHIGAFA